MKKIFLSIVFILMLALLTSCNKAKTEQDIESTETNDVITSPNPTQTVTQDITNAPVITPVVTEPTTNETEEVLTISDYYPFVENTQYIYEGEGNEYASYNVYSDYIKDNRVQLRSNNGGSELINVIENKDGELKSILSRGEIYYRENLLDTTGEGEVEIMLKEPLVKGTEWTVAGNKKRYISDVEVNITTPAGTFNTLEVTTVGNNADGEAEKTIDYYAPRVGLVKTIFSSNDMEVSSTLSEVRKNAPFKQTIRLYYPDADKEVIYLIEKELSFNTNDITRTVLEKVMKEIPKEKYYPTLTTKVKINSLYLNKDNIVCVDFTKDLVSEMNAGASFETLILQCITNTLGNYYGVNKVYITVAGKPYESGHILMKKGENFVVNMENVVK